MTNLDIATLETSVEALIRQQVAAYEAQLREALGRKLAGGPSKKRTAPRRDRSTRRSRDCQRPDPASDPTQRPDPG